MTEPAILAQATQLIRDGQRREAVDRLMTALPGLGEPWQRKARSLAGLAWYFEGRHAEALGMFQAAADGSEGPEDWFNVAMAQVQVGDIEAAHAAWQRCFDLSYQHQDAPESSTFFQKKLILAEALLTAGHPDPRGLDLVERQLMGFFTHYRITDPSYWAIRGVPAFDDVLGLTRRYYEAMGRSRAEWEACCAAIAPTVDEEGQTVLEAAREAFTAPS
ncbi:MAG: hypothetical protein IPI38_02775 [Gemmatimonadetes bacterium]|nr:hypothetical protein [Gemmatimonadota bacterium]MBK6778912.1 hypothetical protein [Gemmatimonadota bacterium]MBK7714342.1 hypothetical protein [Gemmatimonadota bacterium]MBK7783406.1 hypothetical protein [Gemmatimonadota bacterium]MBK7924346.1 hypothetical protein [Gemmatimonadota bacterium]